MGDMMQEAEVSGTQLLLFSTEEGLQTKEHKQPLKLIGQGRKFFSEHIPANTLILAQ